MSMEDIIEKQLLKIEKQEKKYLEKNLKKTKAFSDTLEKKIPPKLRQTIEAAFYKGFFMLFEKGTDVIEKTYDKQKILWEYQFQDKRFCETKKRKPIRKIEKNANRCNGINMTITGIEGAVLGILGIGLPDIPIFLAVILRGIYETSLQYGYDYSEKMEQLYILRLIYAAMAKEENKKQADEFVEKTAQCIAENIAVPYDFEEEVKKTANALSTEMLLAKCIQGLPLVGVTGSGYNIIIYHKILKYCSLKYKKRYLKDKIKK